MAQPPQSPIGLQNTAAPPVLGPLNLPTQFASIGAPVASAVGGAQQQFNNLLMDAIAGKGIFADQKNQNQQQNKSPDQGVLSGIINPIAQFLGIQPQQTANANPTAATAPAPSGGNAPDAYLDRVAQIESGGNPNAWRQGSQYRGLYQFGRDEEAKYGINDSNWRDPAVQRQAAGQLYNDLKDQLGRRLGRDPTDGEIYLAHQQGVAGATALLRNPDTPAAQTLSRFGSGYQRIAGNLPSSWGFDPHTITGQQFANAWIDRYNRQGAGRSAPRTADATPAAGAPMSITAPGIHVTPSPVIAPPNTPQQYAVSGVPSAAATLRKQGRSYPTGGSETHRVFDDRDFDALPSGTRFVGPDGKIRTKP